MASQTIDLSNVDKVEFSQGGVVKEVDILKLNDTVIWRSELPEVMQDFIFTVERYTTNTFVNDTSYTNDEIVAFDVTAGEGGCMVTYGDVTTTIPASTTQQVIYGKYKGVDDGTPTTGDLTISGDYTAVCQATINTAKNVVGRIKNVTGVTQWFGSQLTSLTYFFLTNAEIDAPNFEHKVNITKLAGLMYDGIRTTIPANLIKQCKKVTTIDACFNNCTGIKEIPANLFANNPAITSFNNCFNGCTGITAIPENLFSSEAREIDLTNCFRGCTGITAIPENLFSNISITSFNNCFYGCTGITEIPENLFSNNIMATSFSGCFGHCTGITAIPENLFSNNTQATSLGCFEGCTGITEIPTNLFANNPAVISFSSCFSDCTGIKEIPANLFANNPAVMSFNNCFYGCSSIISIPENLFANNTAVTSFNRCFEHCSGITEIPADLFSNNTAVIQIYWCFASCTSLTAIPTNLFVNNTAIDNYGNCFNGCTALTGTTPVNASGLELWQLAGTTGYPATITGTGCFTNCTGLSNYTNIPSDWGGGATA